MARKKQYIEEEVIEKAMDLFWQKGYEITSMQILEKEMGINKFSIYASFGSKDGVFLESIKCYKRRIKEITVKLEASSNGVKGIKQYFYDFIDFSKDSTLRKGCLVTNTINELNGDANPEILAELSKFTSNIRELFEVNLRKDKKFNDTEIQEKADYLLISIFGLTTASRVFNDKQLRNYIENIFKNV